MTNNVSADKKRLREKILKKRSSLSKTQISNFSRKITSKIANSKDFLIHNNYLAYIPISNEVDTKEIIEILTKNQRSIFLPKYAENKWIISRFRNWKNLENGPFGTMQPKDNEIIDVAQLDLVIIPGVAFDKNRVRLGYGKGIYDRLLRNFRGIKVGLAHDFQIVDKLLVEPHDLKMDVVITNQKVY